MRARPRPPPLPGQQYVRRNHGDSLSLGPDASASAPSLARSGQATFGNLIAALNNIAVNIDELEALNDLTIGDINIVNVENLLNGNNVVLTDVIAIDVLSGELNLFPLPQQ